MIPKKFRQRRLATRRAAAAAELAICLPLIVMLVMASIEACTMIFLDHGLTIASYEGVRVAINFDGTSAPRGPAATRSSASGRSTGRM